MESKIYPGYTAFDAKAPDPGRYIIQVDLADGNDRWCGTWFELADIDGGERIVVVRKSGYGSSMIGDQHVTEDWSVIEGNPDDLSDTIKNIINTK